LNYIRNAWEKVPVLRAFIPFVLGILLAIKLQEIHLLVGVSLAVCLLIVTSLIDLMSIKWRFRLRYFQGILINLAIVFAASFLTFSCIQIHDEKHFSNFLQKDSFLILQITESPEEKEKSMKMLCRVLGVENAGVRNKTHGKLLTYIRKDSVSRQLAYGQVLICPNKVQLVDGPKNPGQFNFKRFLSYKQIYHQSFLDSMNWHQSPIQKGSKLLAMIYKLRLNIVGLLEENISGEDESAIATALLVGYKVDLSEEIKESFASTGAMHVLAVSGLHVGIIFLVFHLLLKPLLKRKETKWLYILLNLFFLWFYAIITGLSPSVLRASAMFSFVIIGRHFRRKPNIYSSLLTSAIFILMVNPFLITQVGFQLSYAAVFGIVFFQPRFYALFNTKPYFLLDKVWALTSVSLAAQLSTFPLGLFYFTMFPVYFLFSNLIVIPAASVIIYLGFTYLIFQALGIAAISQFLVLILGYVIKGLNRGIILIRDLPKGLIEEVYISPEMMICIYLIIFSVALFIINKQKLYFYFSLAALLIFTSVITLWNYRNHSQQRMVFYAIPDASLLGFFDGKSVTFLGDSAILSNYELRKYNTFRDLWRHGCKSEEVKNILLGNAYQTNSLFIQGDFVQFKNHKLIFYDGENHFECSQPIECEYLILHGNKYFDLSVMNNLYKPENIIIDPSVKYYKRKTLKRLLEKEKIPLIDLPETGALLMQ
jgi:competence protein ComEC